MGVGVILVLLLVVMFPLWPPMLRLGVWYLSMVMLGLIGLFFAMSIFRLILFVITIVVASPGIWLYPNLFEDVGFFDSFKPLWAWHKVMIRNSSVLGNKKWRTNCCVLQVGKEKKKKIVVSKEKQGSASTEEATPAAVSSSAPASPPPGTVVPPKPTVEDG